MLGFVWGLVGCAVTAQIYYPLAVGMSRDRVTVAVVVLLAAASLAHALLSRGPGWTLVMFTATAGLGLVAEMVGTATGYPFGSYMYATDRLGPDILGVPAVVPLAWTAGFYPIWCAVTYVLERSRLSPQRKPMHRIAATALGMVDWDLYLDTQMVTDGQWIWTSDRSGLPGIPSIPFTNYLGWFVTVLVMAVAVELIGRRCSSRRSESRSVSDTAPLVLFVWTWLGSALAHAVLLDGDELRYSAIYGLGVMGLVGVPLVMTWIREGTRVVVTE
ncbi:carotenoid biosynthesis protein [Rhodococcus sp. ARC_M6]|uniref:carotenoid biosynthesis protein n=1 Tax=Rhodococcus sp. ARC_M6 TaxID=2928852 RepID=UPI001FB47EBE|nr:carotenoid biosynthesis protein [Rhodococcus sp. ARC_M6]MCJ0904201.1 carotenoid biosynthesis protein [Rhodococcus sp. ARC_M6]